MPFGIPIFWVSSLLVAVHLLLIRSKCTGGRRGGGGGGGCATGKVRHHRSDDPALPNFSG